MRTALAALLAIAIVTTCSAAAFADEWVAVRLRGSVLQLVDGDWVKLKRGGVVPDTRVIRTLKTGNVEFERGNESVTIGPDTQIQIFDEGSAKPFTTVKQYFGTVTIEAEVRQVQHFAVQTPYLAAVVKGTKFVVTSGDEGAIVQVKRGHVFVEDKATKDSVTINAGQTAGVSAGEGAGAALTVDGEPAVTEESGPKGQGPGRSDKHDKPDRPQEAGKPGKGDKPGKAEGPQKKAAKDDKPGKDDKDDKPARGNPHEGNAGGGHGGGGGHANGPSGPGGDSHGSDNGHSHGPGGEDKKGRH